MTREQKDKIDSLWLNSDFGEWCKAAACEDFERAEEIEEKMFDAGYFSIERREEELAEKIAPLFQSEEDIDSYIGLWDKEDYDLAGVLIRVELLYNKVAKKIRQRT